MMSPVEQALVLLSMGVLMIGMGTTLDWAAFRNISQQPKKLVMGLSIQFGIMPLLAWFLAIQMSLSPEAALALILVGCTPGGTSSNMYTWFAKGDVPLSLTMTMFSNIMAVMLMPILVTFYGSNLPLGDLVIPWVQIMGSLFFVLLPVGFGILLKARGVRHLLRIQQGGAVLGMLAVLLMLSTWLPSLVDKIMNEYSPEYLAVILLGNCGFLVGYVLVRITGFPARIARTISLETGLQNTLLTFTIMTLSFSTAFVDQVGWVPLMYGACVMAMGIFWTLLFRRLAKNEIETGHGNVSTDAEPSLR
ncbi:hypothetical protein A9Q99_00285 [Gammaproteobacteria bacterium 45_16_T64]|nr:hypothetical protein A9Q99_00285 [Gammaproteobacteria bacterium 45_16_T64]